MILSIANIWSNTYKNFLIITEWGPLILNYHFCIFIVVIIFFKHYIINHKLFIMVLSAFM